MPEPENNFKSISIAIVGSGGAGAITAGSIILEAAGKSGWYGIMNRSVGPQIRGGEAAALVRLANQPVDCMAENYDLLVAIGVEGVGGATGGVAAVIDLVGGIVNGRGEKRIHDFHRAVLNGGVGFRDLPVAGVDHGFGPVENLRRSYSA